MISTFSAHAKKKKKVNMVFDAICYHGNDISGLQVYFYNINTGVIFEIQHKHLKLILEKLFTILQFYSNYCSTAV